MPECETCGTRIDSPAYTKQVPGYEGPVELWFCERCSK